MDNTLVAHYDLKPASVRTYDVSGNNLIIYEAYAEMIPGTYLVALYFSNPTEL